MHGVNPVTWTLMSDDEKRRVLSAPFEYRDLLVELWASIRGGVDARESREQAEELDRMAHLVTRALDNEWPDGKKRAVLQTVITQRLARLALLHGDVESVRRRDPALYRRFLEGCLRAMKRDSAIAGGELGQSALEDLKARQLKRENDSHRYFPPRKGGKP